MDPDTSTGRTPSKHESGDPGDACTNQSTPMRSENHQKLGERHGTDSLSLPSEGASPATSLILDFLAQNYETGHF